MCARNGHWGVVQRSATSEGSIYTRVIVDEAARRGITVDVLDPTAGELRLTLGERSVDTVQSLSELTSAVAFRRCTHKPTTRVVLERAGVHVPAGRCATFDHRDRDFLAAWSDVVVKPAEGEQGWGITVGVTDDDGLDRALVRARAVCGDVLLEQRVEGLELRVLVIAGEVVAASTRRPPVVVGNGVDTVEQLIVRLSSARAEATAGASVIPLDDLTRTDVAAAGHTFDSVPTPGESVIVRRNANLHTGGTLHDVTNELHPEVAAAALVATAALRIPVVGLDLIVPAVDSPVYMVIEANEQPGLANHEPRPTVERFIDLLFPETA